MLIFQTDDLPMTFSENTPMTSDDLPMTSDDVSDDVPTPYGGIPGQDVPGYPEGVTAGPWHDDTHHWHCPCGWHTQVRADAFSTINPAPATLPCPACKGEAKRRPAHDEA